MRERSTTEVILDHLCRRCAGAVDEDLELNYHPQVLFLTRSGSAMGRDAGRRLHEELLERLPGLRYTVRTLRVEGELALVEWSAEGDGASVEGGVDSFLVRDGRIVVQTIDYDVRSAPPAKPGEPARDEPRPGGQL